MANANNNATNAMESLSLCNYCCSTRSKGKKDDAPIQIQTQAKATQAKATQAKTTQDQVTQAKATQAKATQAKATQAKATQDQAMTYVPIKSKYEFGHATHYVYGVTTPRLLCDFETGTPP
jgi:hypothetical protein